MSFKHAPIGQIVLGGKPTRLPAEHYLITLGADAKHMWIDHAAFAMIGEMQFMTFSDCLSDKLVELRWPNLSRLKIRNYEI
jgi:hypothetical protein